LVESITAMDLRKGYSLSVILVVFIASDSVRTTLGATNFQFTFFLHENLQTVNSSAYFVTQPAIPVVTTTNGTTGSFFGALVVFDDSMTTQPDPNSLEIGRGRGLYAFDANDNGGPGLQFVWTAQFNEATYGPGTTLSFAGFDRITNQIREISIVGGTGMFRYARGYADITTYSTAGFAAVLNITAYFRYGL
jgi:hypothetical protein